jgi:cytochrome c-type biogenesis protein CcmH
VSVTTRPLRAAILVALLIGFSFALASDAAVGAAERATVASISQALTCQCGCGLTVANCNHPTCSFSVPIRDQIETMIGQGKTGPQIIAFYRHKFGEKVLSAPTTEGFNLLAWLMPFVAVTLGGAFIVYTASRWRTRPNQQERGETPGPKSPADSFDPELKHRLEDEIRERS